MMLKNFFCWINAQIKDVYSYLLIVMACGIIVYSNMHPIFNLASLITILYCYPVLSLLFRPNTEFIHKELFLNCFSIFLISLVTLYSILYCGNLKNHVNPLGSLIIAFYVSCLIINLHMNDLKDKYPSNALYSNALLLMPLGLILAPELLVSLSKDAALLF